VYFAIFLQMLFRRTIQLSFTQILCASVLCFLLFSSCNKRINTANESTAPDEQESEKTETVIDPYKIRAEQIASSLDNRLLAAQVLICGIDGKGSLPPHMKLLLTESPPGGVMLFRYNLDTDNDSIRSLVSQTASLVTDEAGIAPFITVDHEGGTVNRFLPGTVDLPAANSYWELSLSHGKNTALEKVESDSYIAGRTLHSLGINLNLAPVAEYLTSDNRHFLEKRSYGPNPFFTVDAAGAFVRGMENAGVLCVIKHFPGSAGADPHYSLSALNMDRASLENFIYPFKELIRSGATAVMIAHSSVPVIDNKIASLSPVVMGNWLRGELGFNGIIICDDFSMAAAGNIRPEEAAVFSVAAGADMVLVWQHDLKRTHLSFLKALEDGRLSRERLEDAAKRIIYRKLKSGLMD
jgi:beta-N-acetylhexosaminidase